jgi:hypothetical protein
MGETLLGFYIFEGKGLKNNYIKFCKLGTCMTM